jgi:hypothetical protein
MRPTRKTMSLRCQNLGLRLYCPKVRHPENQEPIKVIARLNRWSSKSLDHPIISLPRGYRKKRKCPSKLNNRADIGAFSEAGNRKLYQLNRGQQPLMSWVRILSLRLAAIVLHRLPSRKWRIRSRDRIREMNSKYFTGSMVIASMISRICLQLSFQLSHQKWGPTRPTPDLRWRQSLFKISFRATLRSLRRT